MKLFLSATPEQETVSRALFVIQQGETSNLPDFLKSKLGLEEVVSVSSLLKASQAYLEKDFEICVVDASFEKEDVEAFMIDCSNAKKLFASAFLVRAASEEASLPEGFSSKLVEDNDDSNFDSIREALKERAAIHEKRLLELTEGQEISSAEVKFRLLVRQLTSAVPKDLLHMKVLKDIALELDAGKTIKERRISKGTEPTKGKNGKLLLLVKSFTGEASFVTSEHDTVDYRQLHLFDNIRPDQVVGRLYPPTEGEDGVDALGKPVPSEPGDEATVELSEALTLIQEPGKSYQSIKSITYGFLTEAGSKLDVSEEFVVRGNLDLHYGHIDFVGTVIVEGDVLPGFSIRARAGIVINGEVEKASLFCSEGSIEVHGYVHGGGGSKLVSGDSVTLDIAHDLNVEASKDISISKEAIDCSLRAYRSILMSEATLVGGGSYFTTGCEIRTAGSDLGTKTSLYLCNDVEVRSDYSALLTSIREHERVNELLELHLGPYAHTPDRIQLLNDKLRKKMQQLLTKRQSVQSSLEKLRARQSELLADATLLAPIRVNVVSNAFDGVVLHAGEDSYEFDSVAGPLTVDYNRDTASFEKKAYLSLDELENSSTETKLNDKENEHDSEKVPDQ